MRGVGSVEAARGRRRRHGRRGGGPGQSAPSDPRGAVGEVDDAVGFDVGGNPSTPPTDPRGPRGRKGKAGAPAPPEEGNGLASARQSGADRGGAWCNRARMETRRGGATESRLRQVRRPAGRGRSPRCVRCATGGCHEFRARRDRAAGTEPPVPGADKPRMMGPISEGADSFRVRGGWSKDAVRGGELTLPQWGLRISAQFPQDIQSPTKFRSPSHP